MNHLLLTKLNFKLDTKDRRFPVLTPPRAAAIIIFMVFFTYANSLNGEFLFDDLQNIVENPSIKSLSPLHETFVAPHGVGIAGRPFVNFLFALCWALSGGKSWSFHLLSVLIHAGSSIVLFGIVRRTLLLPSLNFYIKKRDAPTFALFASLLWALHPMLTNCVAYITQVCEALMGLLYLLVLYCALRGFSGRNNRAWHLSSIVFMLFGVFTKEVIFTAPLMVLLYQVVFIRDDGFFRSFFKHRYLYTGLFFCWVPLFLLVATGLTASAGPLSDNVSNFEYARTQPQVILHYLCLAFYPAGLSFDYWWPPLSITNAIPYAFALLGLLGLSLVLLIKRHPIGFIMAWFFLILAPTSSIMAMGNLAYEHRMYLSLAAPVALISTAGFAIQKNKPRFAKVVMAFSVCLVIFFSFLTSGRNELYASQYAIWKDTVEKQPNNPRALNVFGRELLNRGKSAEAKQVLKRSVTLNPVSPLAWNDLGRVELFEGNTKTAEHYLKIALRFDQYSSDIHTNFGAALAKNGLLDEAVIHFEKALELKPNKSNIHNTYGIALAGGGKKAEALRQFDQAVKLSPDNPFLLNNLGRILLETGDPKSGIRFFELALKQKPDYETAIINLKEAQKILSGVYGNEIRQGRANPTSEKPGAEKHGRCTK